MDVASGIAGFIGLAALTSQATLKIVKVVKDVQNVPTDLASDLEWLTQLATLLRVVESIFQDHASTIPASDLELLDSFAQSASEVIKRLINRIEKQVTGLDNVMGMKKQSKKLKIVLSSQDTRKDIQEIQRIIEGLHLCHSEVTR